MKIKEIIDYFDEIAPFSLQESYDNSGLQIGNPSLDVGSALLCIDVTEDVLAEAVKYDCDFVISHHPLLFGGVKKITGSSMTERIIEQAIRNSISILSLHTNIDSMLKGVNSKICDKLGLVNRKVMVPVEGKLLKLAFFVPLSDAGRVRDAIFAAGAGVIGNYDQCSYNVEGKGSFRAGEDTDPHVGERGRIHFEDELRVETILPLHLKNRVISKLLETHPYEEVAYDLYPLANKWEQAGMGMTGYLEEEMEELDFLNTLKTVFNTGCVRYTSPRKKKIKKVSVCGGSGSFLLDNAISSGSDVFVSADFKYHQFFEAEGKILVADIGHYESEQFTKELFYENLTKKFPKFAVRLSEVNTNPINYI